MASESESNELNNLKNNEVSEIDNVSLAWNEALYKAQNEELSELPGR